MIKVSACIVSYKCYNRCRDTIKSVLDHTKGCDLSLYIVDNHSEDGESDRFRAEFPQITVIDSPANLGYGGGNNQVLPFLDSEYHAVINPDIEFRSDLLTELSEYLASHPDVDTVTPKILSPDGTDQSLPKRDPFITGLFGRRLFGRLLAPEVDIYTMADRPLDEPTDIEFATGCLFMMRTDLFKKIGGFDSETFFLHFEDADISRRARAEMRLQYLPQYCAVHMWERDTAKHAGSFLVMLRSMFKYFGKWGWRIFSPKELRKGGEKQ